MRPLARMLPHLPARKGWSVHAQKKRGSCSLADRLPPAQLHACLSLARSLEPPVVPPPLPFPASGPTTFSRAGPPLKAQLAQQSLPTKG